MGAVKFVLMVLIVVFAYGCGAYVERSLRPAYATRPEDCKYGATGWELYERYKGGIEKGGVTSLTRYECKNEQ